MDQVYGILLTWMINISIHYKHVKTLVNAWFSLDSLAMVKYVLYRTKSSFLAGLRLAIDNTIYMFGFFLPPWDIRSIEDAKMERYTQVEIKHGRHIPNGVNHHQF